MPIVKPITVPLNGDAKDLEAKIDALNKDFDEWSTHVKKAAEVSTQSAKSSTLSWTDFRSMYSTVLDVVRVGEQVWAKTIGLSQEYADTIRNLSSISGESAQETSRFVQVLDDYNISAEDAMTATKALTKQGYAPTIETLAKLSDQYLKLGDAQAKNEFILKNLGKGGLQWVEVLNKGSDAIRRQGDAVNSSLILNQKQIEASKALFLQMDDLQDATKGLGVSIGNYLTPALEVFVHTLTGSSTSLSEWFGKLAEGRTISIEMSRIMKEQGLLTMWGTTATKDQIEAIREQATINVRATTASQGMSQAQDDGTAAAQRQKEAVQAATDALNDYKDQLNAVSQANKDAANFVQSYADFDKKYAEDHKKAADDLQKSIASGDKDAIATAQKGLQDLETSWHTSTQKMVNDMVLAKLSVDGLTDAEYKAYQQQLVNSGQITQAEADKAKAMMDSANAIVDGISHQEDVVNEKAQTDAKMLELENAKAAAADQTTQAVVNGSQQQAQSIDAVSAATRQEITEQERLAMAAQRTAQAYSTIKMPGTSQPSAIKGSATGAAGSSTQKHASGGDFLIPSSYGNEGFMLGNGDTASAGERVTITPSGQKAGGVTYIVNVYNPKKETAEESMRRELMKLSYRTAIP